MKPLLRLLVDRGCELHGEAGLRTLKPVTVDVLRDAERLDGGGVLLLGTRTADGQPSLAALRGIRRSNPHLIVYLCTPWDRQVLAGLARYTRAGVDQLFTIATGLDVADLVGCVSGRILAPTPASALRAVRELGLASRPLQFALHALRNSQCAEQLEVVAERFGQALRTIEDCVSGAALPRMRDLYRCGRWLHDEELKLCGVLDVSERAMRLGFDSTTSVRQWKSRLRAAARAEERLHGFVLRIPGLDVLLDADGES